MSADLRSTIDDSSPSLEVSIQPKERLQRVVWDGAVVIWATALFVALLAHAYIGLSSRFLSDDYCTAGVIQTHGFFGAQKYWFMTWQGRFSFTLIISTIHLLGSKIVPFIPGTLIGIWLLTLTWTFLQVSRTFSQAQSIVICFFLAELIIVSTLATSPAIYQSLYWETGAVTYVAPLILLTIYIGLVCRIARATHRHRFWPLLWCGYITFVAAGFSETYAALQGGGLCLAILLSVVTGSDLLRKRTLPFFIAGLGGTILACIISLSAPGNEARIASSLSRSIGPPPRNLLSFIELSLRFGFDSLLMSVLSSRLTTAAAALVLPALVAFKLHSQEADQSVDAKSGFKKPTKWLALSPIAGCILIVFCFVPTAYVATYIRSGYHPQPRLFVTSQFVFYCFACVAGYLAGMILRNALRTVDLRNKLFWVSGALSLVFFVVPFNSARSTWALEPVVRIFASKWDEQERKIRAAKISGHREVSVEALPATSRDTRGDLYFGLRLMDSNPDNWVNGCAAKYYGLDFILAR